MIRLQLLVTGLVDIEIGDIRDQRGRTVLNNGNGHFMILLGLRKHEELDDDYDDEDDANGSSCFNLLLVYCIIDCD